MIYGTTYTSLFGDIRLLSNGEALTALYTDFWKGRKLSDVSFVDGRDLPCIRQTVCWLDRYFAGYEPDFLPPLSPAGTAFQKEIWKILLDIPYGHVMTYGEIAKISALNTGKTKMSAQAVGGAVGANPIGIIIPCHRVIGASGNLIGYAGGLTTKIKLLELEGLETAKFFLPKNSRFL